MAPRLPANGFAAIFDQACPSGVGSVLAVDCRRLRANAATVREHIGARFFWAVVKADGYGIGAVEAAKAFLAGGADGLAVARVEEAAALRRAGIAVPILLLGPVPIEPPDDIQLQLTLSTPAEIARVLPWPHAVHLKCDTGMGRLGLPADALDWLESAARFGDRLQGLWTHYSHADTPGDDKNERQRERFRRVLEAAQSYGLKPTQVHLANSGGLAMLQSWENAVRVGLFLYGVDPWFPAAGPLKPLPAVTWLSVVRNLRHLPAGSDLSYRALYRLTQASVVGVVPTGYADGLPAMPAEPLSVTGRAVYPVRGRITMDMAVVEADAAASEGETVCWFGDPNGAANIPAIEKFAAACGRIPYEVLTAVGPRVVRHYIV